VRSAYVLVPLLAACLSSAVLVRLPVMQATPTVLRWVLVLAISTLALVVAHRMLARLLPLAALLELSIEFPGPAPSRYAVARDAGNPAKLHDIVVRAQRGDRMVDLKDAEAARDILALVAAISSHDAQTRGHSERVRVFTDLIAERLRLPAQDRAQLRWAALLHDVGKLSVPGAVLNKTTKLDEEDWQALRRHPAAGARIAFPLNAWLGSWADTVGQHHEKYDGTGYPRGLSGDEICLGARIVAVADAFDVMTAARSYRKPIGRAAALRELTDCSGTHYDPRVVRAMLAVSTPRLRLAMGPLGWLGATPFLALTQGATAAAQATAGALVAGTVVIAGPAASATPAATVSVAPAATSGHHKASADPAAQPSSSARPSIHSTNQPSTPPGKPSTPPGKPTTPPGKPTTPPGKPTTSPRPTPSRTPKPTASKTPKPTPTPTPSPTTRRTGKPTAPPGHGKH
jgi:HD-GYP domain-containing protein (c-di-GMP phosphodiesterase class II)